MKKKLVVCFLFFLVFFIFYRFNDERQKIVIQKIEDTTVALVNKNIAYCGAVWVDKSHLLTANHCVSIIGKINMHKNEKDFYDAIGDTVTYMTQIDIIDQHMRRGKVISNNIKQDLALIDVVNPPIHETTHVSGVAVSDGDIVHIVGHPGGMTWTYIRGYVSASRADVEGPEKINTKMLQVSAPCWQGNSGGGAFNEDGELIGINSWISTNVPMICFFIHRQIIRKFLYLHLPSLKS